mmetsp:Transcript_33402/g.92266  ORF Transcript_33402/g.92266 Transcript_33402/m.92266 type:complete len:676 (-) Transcript_33402:141-2168(-)
MKGRQYGHLEESEDDAICDSEGMPRLAGGEANVDRPATPQSRMKSCAESSNVDVTVAEDAGKRIVPHCPGKAGQLDVAPDPKFNLFSRDDRDAVLALFARLQRENLALRQEVDRLSEVSRDNVELQQVVQQLKDVVISYGYTELEVMNAKPKKGQEGLEQLRYAPRELFIIISMKFAEIAGYYGGAYIYTNYMTEELGMTDSEAGNLYAAYGFISTFLGLGAGVVIDKLGVRKSLLIGTTASALARFTTGLATTKFWATFISLTLFPLGGAFGVPVLALGIRRYSHKDNRKFAFSIFYTMLMLATLMGTMMINQVRGFFPEGTTVYGWHLTWMRITFMLCTALTVYTVIAAALLRDIQVVDDQPLEDMVVEPARPAEGSSWLVLTQIVSNARFWRLSAVSVIFCGVQMGFRHLDATFPKYMMRTYGPNAPWEVVLSVNPIVTFFCAPMCTAFLIKYKVGFRKALILGAFLSGFSPFLFATIENYLGAILWITVMSLGQAIWGPKLYEYSTMSAPTGREGLFVAITASPIYLSSVPTGLVSGWLLEHYCPKDGREEDRHGGLLWFFVGVSVCTSPILLWVFRKRLLKRGEDKPPEQVQDKAQIIGNRDMSVDEESHLPEVPSAASCGKAVAGTPIWGNAGAAWAGMGMGGSLSDDSDADLDENAPERTESSPSMRG